MSEFADIIIDISHEELDKTFQYIIPEELAGQVTVGSEVIVPFGRGNRKTKGYVISIQSQPVFDIEKMKAVESVSPKGVAIEGQLIRLAAWIKENCGSTMIQALKTVLPVKKQVKERKREDGFVIEPEDMGEITLNDDQMEIVDSIENDEQAPDAYLIHGITGSGKTEVYMEIIRREVEQGRAAITDITEILTA